MTFKKIIIFIMLVTFYSYSEEETKKYLKKEDVEKAKRIFIKKEPSPKNNIIKRSVEVKNIMYEDLSSQISSLGEVKIINVGEKIIVVGNEKEVNTIIEIIKELDIPKKQVLIKANIIDTSDNLFERIGVDWFAGIDNRNEPNIESGIVSKFVSGQLSLSTLIREGSNFLGIDMSLLKENGDVVIKAIPTLITLEGEEAELRVTEEVIVGEKEVTKDDVDIIEPIFSEAGIVFNVNPEVRGNKIYLDIKSEVSNFKLTSSYSESSGAKQKNFSSTKLILDNGGSLFLGGLKQNVTKEILRKIPVLGDIPVIGKALFQYRNNSNEIRDIYIEIEAEIL